VFESHAVAVVYLVVETKRTGSETACLPACLLASYSLPYSTDIWESLSGVCVDQ